MKVLNKLIVDLLFLAQFKVSKYKKSNPSETIITYGGTKAIRLSSEQGITRGVNWVLAKRGVFILTDSHLVCGEWKIPISHIINADLVLYRSGMVLKITVNSESKGDNLESLEDHYQFGLQYDPSLLKQRALILALKQERVKYSFFSIAVRAFAVINLALLAVLFLVK